MYLATTERVGPLENVNYHGLVSAEIVVGANAVRDFWAGITDTFGGRSGSYEAVLKQGKDAIQREIARKAQERGANAVVGLRIEIAPANKGTIFLLSAIGTAVTAE